MVKDTMISSKSCRIHPATERPSMSTTTNLFLSIRMEIVGGQRVITDLVSYLVYAYLFFRQQARCKSRHHFPPGLAFPYHYKNLRKCLLCRQSPPSSVHTAYVLSRIVFVVAILRRKNATTEYITLSFWFIQLTSHC